MELQVYSIYDEKGKFFSSPFYAINNAVAIRQFTQLVNDKQSTVSMHPADYTLFQIAFFNDSNAHITALDSNSNLGNGLQYLGNPEPHPPLTE